MISLASWNGSSRVASVSRRWLHAVALFACVGVALAAPAPEPAMLTLSGNWQIKVTARNADGQPVTATLDVTPPGLLTVKAEKLATLPIFNPRAGGWLKGAALATVRAGMHNAASARPGELELRTDRSQTRRG
jgi:hypothetical protein